jgi:hypothetical protein
MRVCEAIVKGLEGVGVEGAFGGAGENAAGLMLALKHSERIRPTMFGTDPTHHGAPRASRVFHGVWVCHVHQPAGGAALPPRMKETVP